MFDVLNPYHGLKRPRNQRSRYFPPIIVDGIPQQSPGLLYVAGIHKLHIEGSRRDRVGGESRTDGNPAPTTRLQDPP